MLNFSLKILAIFGFLYVVLCIFVFINQRDLMFFPSREIRSFPQDTNLREVLFRTQDNITLNGWFIDNQSDTTIIFFHGNGGNISYNQERITLFQELRVNALMFDYRGYGKSESSIEKEDDLYADGEAAYQYILSRGIKGENIILWGQSLGGAIAIHTAQKKKIYGTVVESTFTSLDDISSQIYWFLPTRIMLRFHFKNHEKISNISSPLLIIHSPDDETFSIENGKELFRVAKNPKEFLETRGSHNGGFSQSYQLYVKKLQKLLGK